MTLNGKDKYYELRLLITESLNGTIDPEDIIALEDILKNDPDSRKYYIEHLSTHAALRNIFSNVSTDKSSISEHGFDKSLWQALAEDEKVAPCIHIEKISDKPDGPPLSISAKPDRKMSKLSLFTLAFSSAALLFIMVLVIFLPSPPIVAMLTDSIDAQWVDVKNVPGIGDVLREGEMTLVSGLAEITFNDGAVVIVEAPAAIKLETPKSMFVTSGKVSAVVSEYATGFIVNTASASIVDLGTEFAVNVGGDGSCSLHMFKGRANLVAGKDGQKRTTQIVDFNQARSVNSITGSITNIKLDNNVFARQIDSVNGFVWRGQNLDIADIVGRGNGFGTGRYGSGIDLDSGNQMSYLNYITNRPGHDKYLEVPGNDWIDGVFIPDGRNGGVQIDSQGNTFEDCPDTSGVYWTQISNSGIVAIENQDIHHAVLSGVKYGTNENPSIIMVPNVGITFDLNNIRKDMPGVDISRFTAKCGLSETLHGEFDENSAKDIKSDFWVLIDGEKRFEAKAVNSISGPRDIQLEIKPEDRFLTLIVTDSDMSIGHDWCVFGGPKLILARR